MMDKENIGEQLELLSQINEQDQPDPNKHKFEPREKTVKRFQVDQTFYLDGILFRVHKVTRKSLEVRPVQGAPRHPASSRGGKLPLSLPKPGGMCPLCGGVVKDHSKERKDDGSKA